MIKKFSSAVVVALFVCITAFSQETNLNRHDFMYAGQSKNPRMFIGHKNLGGKTLLYLIDGTYGSRDVNGKPSPKWQKAPFNNEWACSIIASQDPLAVDAVAMDLLISEWPEFGSFSFCDEYLLEAATIPHTNSGATYDPERDGTPLTAPLGIFEHCDKDRKYMKIDMKYVRIDK